MVSRNIVLANGAMVLTQTIFGVGNVVAFVFLSGNPIVFALVREAIAGPLLLALAFALPWFTCKCAASSSSSSSSSSSPPPPSSSSSSTTATATEATAGSGWKVATTEGEIEAEPEGDGGVGGSSAENAGRGDDYVDNAAELAAPTLPDAAAAGPKKPTTQFLVKWYLICGAFVFGCNFFYIIGLKLAGALTAGIWQPSQPIITGAAGLILRLEKFYWLKFFGIIIAVGGCVFHVLYPELAAAGVANHTNSSSAGGDGGAASEDLYLLGNGCLFLNCFFISVYYISQKKLLAFHSPVLVLGYSYAVATVFMVIAALLFNSVPALLQIVCPECAAENRTGWDIPSSDLVGILYWVFFGSIGGYFFFSWANQYIEASLVAAYTALQPVMTGVATYAALAIEPSLGTRGGQQLTTPGLGELGTIPIFIGLGMVVYSNYLVSLEAKQAGDGGAGAAGKASKHVPGSAGEDKRALQQLLVPGSADSSEDERGAL